MRAANPPAPSQQARTEMNASTVYAEIESARNECELNAALEKVRLLPEAGRESLAELIDQRMAEFSERKA